MGIHLKYNKSYLNREAYTWAADYLEGYFEYILHLYKNKELPPESHLDLLIIISDILPQFSASIWEEMGYYLCKEIKKQIEIEGINPYKLGMFSSLGRQAFAVNLYNKHTGHLNTFSRTLNDLLLKAAAARAADLLNSKSETYASHYDCIAGISGILNYLLDTEKGKDNEQHLKVMLDYLVYLSDSSLHEGVGVLNFHIPEANLFTDLEKKIFPNGHLNLGLSHGMLGPLIAMSKARKLGLSVEGLEGATETINLLYDQYRERKDGISIWPCYLSPNEYANGLMPEHSSLLKIQRSGWCYGNISIARGLQIASMYSGDKEREGKYLDFLLDIIDAPIEAYNLDNPGLCHGFASVMTIGAYTSDMGKMPNLISPMNRCVLACKEIFADGSFASSAEIIEQYFEKDVSLLQGAGGLAAGLLKIMHRDMEFGKILMIN